MNVEYFIEITQFQFQRISKDSFRKKVRSELFKRKKIISEKIVQQTNCHVAKSNYLIK